MKAATLRDMSSEELVGRVDELKNELFNLRFQLATGQLTNTMQIRECRKDIARCKTILHERELDQAKARA